jgi:hypothetical protein
LVRIYGLGSKQGQGAVYSGASDRESLPEDGGVDCGGTEVKGEGVRGVVLVLLEQKEVNYLGIRELEARDLC